MRGKVLEIVLLYEFSRITPAYAGKSLNSTLILFMIKDHPRLCGEKVHSIYQLPQSVGSPPPMRGKVPFLRRHKRQNWITPAYAGKSYYITIIRKTRLGSPPPMRGKVRAPPSLTLGIWITPAYAGKRSQTCRYSRRT